MIVLRKIDPLFYDSMFQTKKALDAKNNLEIDLNSSVGISPIVVNAGVFADRNYINFLVF